MLPKVSLDQSLKDKTKIKKKNSYFQENLFENIGGKFLKKVWCCVGGRV